MTAAGAPAGSDERGPQRSFVTRAARPPAMVGTSGSIGVALCAGGRQRAHLAGADMRQRRRRWCRTAARSGPPSDRRRLRGAAIGHVRELDRRPSSRTARRTRCDSSPAPRTRSSCVRGLAPLPSAISSGIAVRRQLRMRAQHERRAADHRDRREILDRIVGEIAVSARRRRMRAGVGEPERIAVRLARARPPRCRACRRRRRDCRPRSAGRAARPSFCPTRRATVSELLPAWNGTMKPDRPLGPARSRVCASAAPAASARPAKARAESCGCFRASESRAMSKDRASAISVVLRCSFDLLGLAQAFDQRASAAGRRGRASGPRRCGATRRGSSGAPPGPSRPAGACCAWSAPACAATATWRRWRS